MDVIRDPDRVELKHLLQQADFAGAKVLELGCGDGRLTWQYGELAGEVYGIDPDLASLRSAADARPETLQTNLIFVLSEAETLPFANNAFAVAIMAWSL
ncbi:MAG: class I SAM-dependent methyltransferase [Anaerolineales bacterium]